MNTANLTSWFRIHGTLLYFMVVIFPVFLFSQQRSVDSILGKALLERDSSTLNQYFEIEEVNREDIYWVPDYFFKSYESTEISDLVYLYKIGLIELNSNLYFELSLFGYLAKFGELKILEEILQNPANTALKFADGSNILMQLLKHDQTHLAKKYLRQFDLQHLDDDGNSILFYCRGVSNTEIIQELVNQGVKINHRNDLGFTALRSAVNLGNENVSFYLLDTLSIDYSAKKDRLLLLALRSHSVNLAKRFIETERDFINEKYFSGTPLLHEVIGFYSAKHNETLFDIITFMIEKGYEINAINTEGYNLLAYTGENLELFRFLLEKGMRPDVLIGDKTIRLKDKIIEEAYLKIAIDNEVTQAMFKDNLLTSIVKLSLLGEYVEVSKLLVRHCF